MQKVVYPIFDKGIQINAYLQMLDYVIALSTN